MLALPAAEASAHRIGVRVVDGQGEFYDRQTGDRFVGRGFNYIRVGPQPGVSGPYHSTFTPGQYDPSDADQALTRMHHDGYNLVRVFISEKSVLAEDGTVSQAYLENVSDFLRKAQSHSIYVFVTLPFQPYNYVTPPGWSWINSIFLRSDGVSGKQRYLREFITGLQALDAPMEAVFGWGLENEVFFDSDFSPLSDTAGLVTTANGRTYDMASAAEKEKMINEGLVYLIDQGRETIRQVDPTALVGVGFFWDQAPHPAREGDARVIHPSAAIEGSTADFFDLHPYPGAGLTISEMADNFGMVGSPQKAYLMGEFGLVRLPYDSAARAAQVLQDWQVESCAFGFDGWLLWTWDREELVPGKALFWSGLSENGMIETALSPLYRPDPCRAGPFPGQNRGFRRPARSSAAIPDHSAQLAVDGELTTAWMSGDYAPQWIEIDLQETVNVTKIRLVVNQYPDGATVHRVWGRGPASDDREQLLYEFRGGTTSNQVLETAFPAPGRPVRFIRVETTESPSWVSWSEIEIYGDSVRRRRAVRHW